MAINLATKFLPYVDEKFSTESKKSLLTNQDFDWTGAHTVKVYKVSTSAMNDYSRNTSDGLTGSRYGVVKDLDATTQEMTLTKDRSFTFAIDKLDTDETAQNLQAASALERQLREVVIPEVDAYTYGVMCANAGNKPTAKALTKENIYLEILAANNALDNAEEAVRKLEDHDKRAISVSIFSRHGIAILQVENFYEGDLRFVDGLPVTTKGDPNYHGFGLKSIRSTAEKYGGTVSVQAEDGLFLLRVALPVETE